MSKPMFSYTGISSDAGDAAADCADIKKLHESNAIGSYDAQIIVREPDGSVRVTKTENPVEHGAWIGAAAGAGAAVLFPALLPAVVVAGVAGAGVGAWAAHLAHGMSRGEAKRIDAKLNDGDSAVVVIGIDHDAGQVESAASRAREHVLKHDVGDWDDAEQDALESVKQADGATAVTT